jgi:hypothetical protein
VEDAVLVAAEVRVQKDVGLGQVVEVEIDEVAIGLSNGKVEPARVPSFGRGATALDQGFTGWSRGDASA